MIPVEGTQTYNLKFRLKSIPYFMFKCVNTTHQIEHRHVNSVKNFCSNAESPAIMQSTPRVPQYYGQTASPPWRRADFGSFPLCLLEAVASIVSLTSTLGCKILNCWWLKWCFLAAWNLSRNSCSRFVIVHVCTYIHVVDMYVYT